MKVRGKKMPKRSAALVIRDAEMVLLFRDGKTMQEIAGEYGISRERVRQRLASLGLDALDGGSAVRRFVSWHEKADAESAKEREREQKFFARYAMSRADMDEITTQAGVTISHRRHPARLWSRQKLQARKRGIEWQMTFADWWRIWQQSGHWEERGRGNGYCMARWADDGPYSVDNVYICTIGQNFSDSYITKPWTDRFPDKRRSANPRDWRKPGRKYWPMHHGYMVQLGKKRRFAADETEARALLTQHGIPA